MHSLGFLGDFLILLTAVVLIIPLFRRLRIPTILGFIVAGVIIGPNVTGLIAEADDVATLAEIGVVFLLFTIGMEISYERIARMWRSLLIGGGLQMLLTIGIVAAGMNLMGMEPAGAVFAGFLFSLSSTAIVLKILHDRGESQSPQGKISLSILVFQDLAFIPLMILTPMLAAAGSFEAGPILETAGRSLLLIAALVLATRYLFPWLINYTIRTASRELFVLVVVVLSLGTAYLSSLFGLSPALGAFVAGVGLSRSEYSDQIAAEVAPVRDILGSLFFISLGMLVNFSHVIADPAGVGLKAVLLLGAKVAAVIPVVLILGSSIRVAVLTAFALAQVGEFSLILAQTGRAQGLLYTSFYDDFNAVTLISMMTAPFLIQLAPVIADPLRKLAAGRLTGSRRQEEAEEGADAAPPRTGHVIIVGYGLNGKNVATVLHETGTPYVVSELDVERFRAAKADGHPAQYGDGTRVVILSHLGIQAARVLVVAISDPLATRTIVRTARRMNEKLHLIVRTRYVSEINELHRAGADEVIPEEFETSIEIFTRVLRHYHVPRNVIASQVDLLRREGYGMMRGLKLPQASLDHLEIILSAGTADSYLVVPGNPSAGRSLAELDVRKRTGATVMSIVREGKPMLNPPGDTRIQAGDTVVLIGKHNEVDRAFDLLEGGVQTSQSPDGSG